MTVSCGCGVSRPGGWIVASLTSVADLANHLHLVLDARVGQRGHNLSRHDTWLLALVLSTISVQSLLIVVLQHLEQYVLVLITIGGDSMWTVSHFIRLLRHDHLVVAVGVVWVDPGRIVTIARLKYVEGGRLRLLDEESGLRLGGATAPSSTSFIVLV